MTELKTLKDLKNFEGSMGSYPMVLKREVREEAIKRAKWRFKYHTEYKLAEDFINFFNITEEELSK